VKRLKSSAKFFSKALIQKNASARHEICSSVYLMIKKEKAKIVPMCMTLYLASTNCLKSDNVSHLPVTNSAIQFINGLNTALGLLVIEYL